MSVWDCPLDHSLDENWIVFPNSFKKDRTKIRETVETIVKPRFEAIGQFWKELSYKVRIGVPIAAVVIFAVSSYYFFVPGILLGGMILAICVIGKTGADEIRKNDLKRICFECESFLGQFEENCRTFLTEIKGEASVTEALQNFKKPGDIPFNKLRKHLEDVETELKEKFLQIYKTEVFQFHLCFLDLQSTTGYFVAKLKDSLKESLIANLEGKSTSLGLIAKIKRVKDNIQALRCSL